MIYNLPRKAKKKYTWYKYSAADNRNIVTESTDENAYPGNGYHGGYWYVRKE